MRGKVADVREARYGLDHEDGGCYLFRMDADNVVDATKIGSIARFINHSCNPNSYSKVVTVDKGLKKIIIFAKRAIRKGDELVYDYQVRERARVRELEWVGGEPRNTAPPSACLVLSRLFLVRAVRPTC